MTKSKKPNAEFEKLFGKSSLTTVSSVVVLCGIIILVIVASPIKSTDNQHLVSEPYEIGDSIRIYAPADEIDSFLRNESSSEAQTDTYGNNIPEFQIETSVIYNAPEIAANETTASPIPDTTAQVTIVPQTIVPQTAAPVTTAPQTPPAQAEKKESSGSLLADKLGVVYTTVRPMYEVSEYEITIAATVIQLEVMGSGSSLDKFEDETLKYWEMLAVAECIRNRVMSKYFPDSVEDVLFDCTTVNGKTFYQFSPASKIEKYTPTEEAITAAREVLIDGVTVLADNYYYFCASNIESRFEKNNTYSLVCKSNGTYEKTRGDTTTFYAGFDE